MAKKGQYCKLYRSQALRLPDKIPALKKEATSTAGKLARECASFLF
jgi:hypothetical protein